MYNLIQSNMRCVYGIINLVNGKKYIGSTCNFSRRKREHLWMLKNNKHKNIHLQNAWNKNNGNDFLFIVIEKIDDNRSIYDVEQIYLDKYQTYNKKIGYNICKESNNINITTKKIVYQYSKHGELIKEWGSLADVALELNCNYSGISNAAKGKCRTAKGFIWIFKNDFNDDLLKKKLQIGQNRKHTEESINNLIKSKLFTDNVRHVMQYNFDNELIAEFKSIRQASLLTGFGQDAIRGLCNGNYKKGKTGFIFKYKNK